MTTENVSPFTGHPHVTKRKASFVKKKISFTTLDRDSSAHRGDVIRADEISKVISIDQYISKATSVIGKIVKKEQIKTRRYEAKIQDDIKTQAWEEVINEIKAYQEKQDKYFDLLESHCMEIVKCAISTIVSDFDDDIKVCSTIESIISKTKNENDAVIVVSPEHEELASKFALDNDWKVETSSKLESNECELRVKNGSYRSHFSGCLDALYSTLNKEKNINRSDSQIFV